MKIQGWITPPALSASQAKVTFNTSNNPLNIAQSNVTISKAAFTKYDFLQRFQLAAQASGDQSGFIKDYASEYNNMKKEIMADGTEDQQNSLAMLDEVYGEVTKQAAEQLSAQFDNFFDNSNALQSGYKMTPSTDLFDRQAFYDHLIGLSEVAKNLGSSDPAYIKDQLSQLPAGNALESMSYNDITNLTNAIHKLSILEIPRPVGVDLNKFGEDLAEWHLKGNEILASAGLSDTVRAAAEKSFQATVDARLKTGSYAKTIDIYKSNISDTIKRLSQLMFMYAKNEGNMKEQGIDPNDPIIQRQLDKEHQLTLRIEETRKELKDRNEQLHKLEKNPDSITETDEYKAVKKSYDKSMQAGR